MVTNILIKCKICNKVFRLRWQIGYKIAEVNILCPECNSKVKAILEEYKSPKLINAIMCNSDEANQDGDYLVEVSTEFLTKKISTFTDRFAIENLISPFLRAINKDNFDKINELLNYGYSIKHLSTHFESVINLYYNPNKQYLKKILMSNDNSYAIMCRNAFRKYNLATELDYLAGSHHYLISLIRNTFLSETNNNINEFMKVIGDEYGRIGQKIIDFADDLNKNNVFYLISTKFSFLVSEILDIFLNLVPIYMNIDLNDVDLDTIGITTLDIEKMISIYKKCYEFLGSFVILPIGLNNIIERNNCNLFHNGKEHEIYEFLESISSKFNRYNDFLKEHEKFSHMFIGGLNNIIRNSEAHFDYYFNQLTQKIKFVNNHKGDIYEKEMYLVEFAVEVIKIYQKCVLIWEMSYQLNELFLISKGENFSML